MIAGTGPREILRPVKREQSPIYDLLRWRQRRAPIPARPRPSSVNVRRRHDLASVIDVERLSIVITTEELNWSEGPGGVQKSRCVVVPDRRAHDLIQIIDTVRHGDDAVREPKGHNAFVREEKTESSERIDSGESTNDMTRVVNTVGCGESAAGKIQHRKRETIRSHRPRPHSPKRESPMRPKLRQPWSQNEKP